MKTELTIVKAKCSQDMVGQDIIIPATEESQEIMNPLPYGLVMGCNIKYKGRHNLERHDLFHACIKLVADNTGKNRQQIYQECLLAVRWHKGYAYYKDKDGKERINVILKSTSFIEMSLQDAEYFYNELKPFDELASMIGITADELVREAKLRMKGRHYCILCGAKATDKHHKFSQSKINIAKYGRDLINNEFNIVWLCNNCHASHNKIPKELNWNEKRFIQEAKRNGYLLEDNLKQSLLNTFEGQEVNK
jgi:hypothetical protein